MPRPTGYTETWSASLTGSAPVNSLIGGTKWESVKWSDPTAVTLLTYSFMTPGVSYFAINYSSKNEYLDSYSLTAAQQTAVSNALDSWSSVANILFNKTSDNIVNVGDLRFGGYASMDDKTAAWAYLPDETPKGGDVWIGPETSSLSPVKGSYDYLTFMHEIGHAIGLKHPFSASALNPTIIDPSVDDVRYTIMSYNDSYSYQPTTPMLLDILAIQNLYGANTHWQAGNTTYSWAPTQSVFETIWDSGGVDTIDGTNQLAGVKINLNEGQFSNIGKSFLDLNTLTAINNGLTIAWGTKIENAVGSAFDDVLTGNALDNLLVGNEGADTMIGGAGNDTYYVDNVGDVVVETSTLASEIDTVNSSIDYTLGANVENLNLIGSANLNATGNELGNRITGNSGNNIIDGGAGADYMAGGTGNDTYIVDNVGDYVVETSTIASEIDTVRSSVSFTLGANLENLTLTGTANIDGIGNSLNNVLIGNDGNNQLNGGAGLDTMIGGKGDDAYGIDQAGELALVQENANEGNDTLAIVYAATAQNNVIDLNLSNLQNVENVSLYAAGAFTVLGNALDNVLIGNADANTLQGGAGNDVLNGGAGADALIGGTGDDTYIVDNVGDTVVENLNEGHDLVQASVSYTLSANVEDGVLTGSAHINLTGNSLDNVLTGNSGSNVLDGGAGADIMNGGAGNDSYYVDNIGDVVIETGTSASEIDAVNASIDYTLGANVEWLNLIGTANLNGTGNSLDNRITGNSGNNILDGGLGADYMAGGTGNDTYIVDNVGDVVVETSTLASEIDTVKASITYTLGANVENLTLTGTANIDGIGNSLNNVLIGNDGNNQLNGGAGLDTMIGGKGDDAYG
ncbi:M10 family metallopeptidase C-terminal domain-containing protein, partial [Pseudomonas sp. SDO52101_S400]